MKPRRLLLFDIDGTLLHCGGSGMSALRKAVEQVLGEAWRDGDPPVRPDGRTDPDIIRHMLQTHGVPTGRWRELETQVMLEFPALFEAELESMRSAAGLYEGVTELLTHLEGRSDEVCLGVLTGNMRETAATKLRAFGLDRFFPVGAYGCDCADRNKLGRIALERARRHFRDEFAPEHCWIIGDTDRDVHCARAAGFRVVAVATGRFSLPQLQEHLPDHAVSDLRKWQELVPLLLR